MNENSDRNSVIALLEKLGDENDAEVLAAGRALHAKIADMGVDWEQLLVPDGTDAPEMVDAFEDDEDDEDLTDDDDEESLGDDETPPADDEFEPVGDAADDLKQIDRLLAASGISVEFQEELKGYKEDIKANEFSAADRKYVLALQSRLAGEKKSKSRA